MEVHLAAVGAVTLFALAFWCWMHRLVLDPDMSGDKWYMRQFAFSDDAISPPYCWRPLLPLLARRFGFSLVSYTATAATPVLIYFFVGGGWAGVACACAFIGNKFIWSFNIKNPEYTEGLGQLLFIASLFAMREGWLVAYPLMFLSALCRETIAAALGAIALFWNPWLLIPLCGGSAAAYLLRSESKDNRHPLVEDTPYATLVRWARVKGGNVAHWAHTIQPLRGTPLAVPFVWGSVDAFARLGLIGLLPIWLLALPASGQSRLMCYGFGILAPYIAALPIGWAWFFVAVAVFWPFDFTVYDESGGKTFGFAK